MKKTVLLLLIFVFAISVTGCDNTKKTSGSGESKITGSIAYFYGDEETAIKTFNSEDTLAKEIELSKEKTYTIGLRPSFKGSKAAVYIGDCAAFSYDEGCCEIKYIAEQESEPIYEFIIKTDVDFWLSVSVDGFVQSIKILVQ